MKENEFFAKMDELRRKTDSLTNGDMAGILAIALQVKNLMISFLHDQEDSALRNLIYRQIAELDEEIKNEYPNLFN